MSEKNLKAIEDAGSGFIVSEKLPKIPHQTTQWHKAYPGIAPADRLTLTQPIMMGLSTGIRRKTVYYQYKANRDRRSMHGCKVVGSAEGLVDIRSGQRESWLGKESTIMNHYSEEFKADTVSLVESGTPQNKVCRDLGISKSALSK